MPLTIGELTGYIDLDDGGFGKALTGAESDFGRFGAKLGSGLDGLAGDFDAWTADLRGSTSDLGDDLLGEIIASLDEADAELKSGLGHSLDGLDETARTAGKKAGDELGRGLEDGIDGAGAGIKGKGKGAGEGFGEGAEGGSRGRLSGLGGKLAGLVGKAGPWLAAGTAIGGVLLTGLQGAMEKQNATAKLNAQLGAFGPRAKLLGKVTGDLYANAYGESMGDVTNALRAVVTNMDGFRNASSASLKSVTADAMNLATIMDEDVTAVTRAAGQMMRTGLAKNAKEAFDVLVRGAQLGGNKAEDLLDTFNEYSTQFRDMGLSGRDAMGLIMQGLRGGARDSDLVADALKELNIRVKTLDTNAVPALKKLGLNAHTMAEAFTRGGPKAREALSTILDRLRSVKDPAKRAQLAMALFGTQAEDTSKALYGLNLDKAAGELGKVGGAAKKAGDTLNDTASSKLEAFQRSVKQHIVDALGGQVLPFLQKWGGKAGAAVTDWLNHNQDVVAKFRQVWAQAGALFGKVIGDVKKWIEDNKSTVDGWGRTLAEILRTVAAIVSNYLTFIGALWARFGPGILESLSVLITTFLGMWRAFFEIVRGIYEVFAGLLTGDWSKAWQGMQHIVEGFNRMILAVILGVLGSIKATFDGTWTAITGKVSKSTASVSSLVRQGMSNVLAAVGWLAAIPGRVAGYFGRMTSAAISKAGNLVSYMRGIPGRIRSAVGSLSGVLWQAGRNVINGLIRGIDSMLGWLRSKLSAVTRLIPSWKGPMSVDVRLLRPNGRAIMASLVDGITAGLPGLHSTLADVTDGIGASMPAPTSGAGAAAAGGSGRVAIVRLEFGGADGEFKRFMQKIVRTDGGGDVQTAFGG